MSKLPKFTACLSFISSHTTNTFFYLFNLYFNLFYDGDLANDRKGTQTFNKAGKMT